MSLIKWEKGKKEKVIEMQHASDAISKKGVPMAHADGYQSLERVQMPLLGKNSNGN